MTTERVPAPRKPVVLIVDDIQANRELLEGHARLEAVDPGFAERDVHVVRLRFRRGQRCVER